MNRRYQPQNRIPYNSANYSNNNYSSFKPISRRPRVNKRYIPIARRNRLQRVQNVINYPNNFHHGFRQRSFNNTNNNNINNNSNKVNNANTNKNNNREIYVKGLPRYIDEVGLFNLFRKEGRIINCNVLYDNVGFSRGTGRILFANFKDVVNVIKKWNDTEYKGNILKVEYKTSNNVGNRNNMNNKYGNKNNNNRNNYYQRPFNFNQANHYSNKFRNNYYYNNYNNNNNGYNRYRSFNNNVNY